MTTESRSTRRLYVPKRVAHVFHAVLDLAESLVEPENDTPTLVDGDTERARAWLESRESGPHYTAILARCEAAEKQRDRLAEALRLCLPWVRLYDPTEDSEAALAEAIKAGESALAEVDPKETA